MRQPIIAFISTLLLSLPNIALANQDPRTFGQPGSNGNHGYNGSSGRNGGNRDIFADGQTQTYDLSGIDGEDGTDGQSGYYAAKCQQPQRPAYNLIGTNGGKGGSGGNGGNGGDGGDFTIYYNDISQLKRIIVDNSGGKGGRAGRGAPGGAGCSITESQWQVKYCTWELWFKRKDIPDSKWQAHERKRTRCTGVHQVDAQNYTPPFPRVQSNIALQWKYLGISQAKTYQARAGKQGNSGKNGQAGKNGSYGQVSLIPRSNIPLEKVSSYDLVTNLIGKQIDLSKNFWSKRQGLRSLLNAASNVPDSFKYLNIANLSYRVDWQAAKTPQQLEIADIKIGGEITLNNLEPKISLDLSRIPETIDYQVNTKENLTTLAITGGFAASRLQSFEVVKYGGNQPNEIIIRDNGKVRDLLANTKISVTARITQENPHPQLNPNRDDYRHSDELVFEVPSSKPATGSIAVNDNQYTLTFPLSTRALKDFWFGSGADITYNITVIQTTKKGTEYRQDMDVKFVIP